MKKQDNETRYIVDDKWKLLITIFRITFTIIVLLFLYMNVMCFIEGKISYSIITLPFLIICLIIKKQLNKAIRLNDLRNINKLLRGGMRIIGMLY